MIRRPTVLVLGAGASAPYGYPLGAVLVEYIVRQLLEDRGEVGLTATLTSLGFRSEDVTLFAERLRDSGLTSIDAFLEGNSEEFINIGKAAIAYWILWLENRDVFFRKTPPLLGHWYQYVWNLVRPGSTPDNFGENRLSVVTFNYDRSFEFYFTTVVKNTFNLDSWDQAKALFEASVRIVHLHGLLGGAESLGVHTRPLNPQVVSAAASRIRVVHEAVPEDGVFGEAWQLLREAERVAFLGFGFHPTNVARLRLKECVPTITRKHFLAASAYGMGMAEVDRAKNALARSLSAWGTANQDVLEFLREVPVFI